MVARRPWRGAGILVGQLADAVVADPARAHPVAGFGWCAAALERLTYRDGRAAGALQVAVLVGALAGAGAGVERSARRGPVLAAVTAAATWVALGGTTLARTGTRLADLLDAGDVEGARA
ncbi:MAG: cobalamin biosynthesis protein, partial [Mycobacterium sp.]|nr:cobalamin biosynthesis protein [Mycobacterium sp.]